jgi:hypothetical protein
MNPAITAAPVLPGSAISQHLAGAHFQDCFEMPVAADAPCALDFYLGVVRRTPAWVDTLMTARNRAVALVGLKDLGHLGSLDPARTARDYRVGDRIGIFKLLQLSENEVILGDSDKHLDVKVSVYKRAEASQHKVSVSTVVHIHNRLGRLYMLFVAPVHKRIVPAMLARAQGR